MLTERQEQVIELKGRGISNREIACELGINESTVHEHLQLAMQKLGTASATTATILFERQKLIESLRESGMEETLRAFLLERTGSETLGEVTMEHGLPDVLEYIGQVVADFRKDD